MKIWTCPDTGHVLKLEEVEGLWHVTCETLGGHKEFVNEPPQDMEMKFKDWVHQLCVSTGHTAITLNSWPTPPVLSVNGQGVSSLDVDSAATANIVTGNTLCSKIKVKIGSLTFYILNL